MFIKFRIMRWMRKQKNTPWYAAYAKEGEYRWVDIKEISEHFRNTSTVNLSFALHELVVADKLERGITVDTDTIFGYEVFRSILDIPKTVMHDAKTMHVRFKVK